MIIYYAKAKATVAAKEEEATTKEEETNTAAVIIPILNIDDKDTSEKVIMKTVLQEILIHHLSNGQKINPYFKL